MFDKKGDFKWGEFIFIFLNILVFVIVLVFVQRAASGALVYEEVYAKEIALLIDTAQPGTDITVDVSKALEIAKKNDVSPDSFKDLIVIDNEKNIVRVNLGRQGGSSFRFFSDYTLVSGLRDKTFVVRVREKGEVIEDEI